MSKLTRELTREDFESLARFRFSIRQYLHFAERGARAVGLTAQQHQALLAIKAQSYSGVMTVGELAGRLLLRPHSAAELVNRLATANLIIRTAAERDRRKVTLHLTPEGEAVLTKLSESNLRELQTATPALETLIEQLTDLAEP